MAEENKAPTIYLAGGKSNWRDEFVVTGATLFDPMEGQRGDEFLYPFQYASRDEMQLRSSDFLVACHDYHRYSGLSLEIGMAYGLGIPAIIITKMGKADSFITNFCLQWFTDVGAAAEWVQTNWIDTFQPPSNNTT